MKKILVVFLALIFVLSCCAFAEENAPLIYYIGKDANSAFWQTVNSGAEQAAADYGFELVSLNPQSESEINAQIDMVATAVNAGATGIALAPLDTSALISACQEALEAGVNLTLLDSVIASEDYKVAYKTDNYAAGAAQARALAEKVGGKGKVFVLTAVAGSESCNLRDQGFIAEIQENWPEMEVINADEQINANNDINQGMTIVTDVLAANPDLVGIFGDNNYAAQGCAIAVKESGADVVVVGFDSDTDLCAMLEEGTIYSLAVQKPYMMGYMSVEGAYKLSIGEEIEHGVVDTGYVIVTKENMNDEDIKPLL